MSATPKPRIVLYNPCAVFYTMPLAILALASALDRRGVEVIVIDGRLERDPIRRVLAATESALCLGVTVLTGAPIRDALAVSGTDGAIRVWDLRTRVRRLMLRTQLHERAGHDAVGLCLAFSPDGRFLSSGHVDGAAHLWDMSAGLEVPVNLRHESSVGALAFSPDGMTLASGGMDANLKLWDLYAAIQTELLPRLEEVRVPVVLNVRSKS